MVHLVKSALGYMETLWVCTEMLTSLRVGSNLGFALYPEYVEEENNFFSTAQESQFVIQLLNRVSHA